MRAFLFMLLLFPVLELYVFFQVSTAIGFFPALLLVIVGSALGILVMRVAGFATALRTRQSLQRGEMPGEQMFQGLMLAVGGGLLLLPGFISDVLGLLLLLPPTRRWLAGALRRRAEAQRVQVEPARQGREPDVIEGDFERRDP
jgi:UPF0716 protein FxsA